MPHQFSRWSSIIDFGNGSHHDNVVFALFRGMPFLCTYSGHHHFEFHAKHPILLNRWNHIACSLAGNQAHLYQNGIRVRSCRRMPIPIDVERTTNYIGKSNWNKPYPNAFYRNIRIWKGALIQEQLQKIRLKDSLPITSPRDLNLENNMLTLMGYWKCNEGYGRMVFNHAAKGPENGHGILGGGNRQCAPKWVIPPQQFYESLSP